MPRPGRKMALKASELSFDDIYALETGYSYASSQPFTIPDGEEDDAARHAAWQMVGAALTELHIDRCPCSRPHAWFLYETTDVRRIALDGSEETQARFLERNGLLTPWEQVLMLAPEGEDEDGIHRPHIQRRVLQQLWDDEL